MSCVGLNNLPVILCLNLGTAKIRIDHFVIAPLKGALKRVPVMPDTAGQAQRVLKRTSAAKQSP